MIIDLAAFVIAENEGFVEHMYLDTLGHVTVGAGHRILNEDAAMALPWVPPRPTSNPWVVPNQAIREEYRRVKAMKPGLVATAYKVDTSPVLTLRSQKNMLRTKIEELFAALSGTFSMDQQDGAVALLDMAYNLGVTGLKAKFPKFCAAYRRQDWLTCIAECSRLGVGRNRNRKTAKLFVDALIP